MVRVKDLEVTSLPNIRSIRAVAGLSRPELARFLGVSESTIVRWETARDATEPRGVQAVLLQCLLDALALRPPAEVASLVRLSASDHRRAIKALLEAAEVQGGVPGVASRGAEE